MDYNLILAYSCLLKTLQVLYSYTLFIHKIYSIILLKYFPHVAHIYCFFLFDPVSINNTCYDFGCVPPMTDHSKLKLSLNHLLAFDYCWPVCDFNKKHYFSVVPAILIIEVNIVMALLPWLGRLCFRFHLSIQ